MYHVENPVQSDDRQIEELGDGSLSYERLIELAKEEYECEDIEVDDLPYTSRSKEGAWVQAWVWIPYET